jgi:hypothetical protein
MLHADSIGCIYETEGGFDYFGEAVMEQVAEWGAGESHTNCPRKISARHHQTLVFGFMYKINTRESTIYCGHFIL